jgi:DNA polymerase-3 subunit gamma/tau
LPTGAAVHIAALLRHISEQDAEAVLAIVAELTALSRNLSTVLSDLAETVHRVALLKCAPGYRDADRSDWDSITELAELLSPEEAQLYYQVAIKGQQDIGLAPDPRTGLEMTLMRMMAFRPARLGTGDGGQPPLAAKGRATGTSPSRTHGLSAGGAIRKPKQTRPERARPDAAPAPEREVAPTVEAPRERVTIREAQPDMTPAIESNLKPHTEPEPEVAQETAQPVEPDSPESEPGDPSDRQPSLLAGPAATGKSSEWLNLSRRLNLRGPTAELARNITLQSSDGDQWQFVIPASRAHLSSPKYLHHIGEALEAELGHPVNVSLRSADSTVETPASVSEHVSRQRMSEAEKSITDDPTVQELKERFGAVLDTDSIQPLQ